MTLARKQKSDQIGIHKQKEEKSQGLNQME
jgi:hypothetical protein